MGLSKITGYSTKWVEVGNVMRAVVIATGWSAWQMDDRVIHCHGM